MPSLRLDEIEDLMKEDDELSEIEIRRKKRKEEKNKKKTIKFDRYNRGDQDFD